MCEVAPGDLAVSDLEDNSALALVGDQQDAFVRIRAAAARYLPARGENAAPDGATFGVSVMPHSNFSNGNGAN
ncbi:hypothetical protein AB0D57_45860 [Streptomyces sp. NPDC048275]|uniref:hypothetical protein n=1 Tax=Streptomyces sp. NPDC048275 TaxID=3155629 RepID=UPI003403E443